MHPDVEEILEDAHRRAEAAERNLDRVEVRSFLNSVEERREDGLQPVIAEVKPTSPTSDGVASHDPVEAAKAMERGGAAAISVLTEPERFGGSLDLLRDVRNEVDLPVLRKDFVVDRRQMYEVECDLLLLIAAFVDDLQSLVDEAMEAGFEPLVEVHTEEELDMALKTDARVVGVNNRDLTRLEVDLGVGERLLPEVPGDRVAVAESGVDDAADVRRLASAGADAFLVGTSIMRCDDVEGKTRELVEADV